MKKFVIALVIIIVELLSILAYSFINTPSVIKKENKLIYEKELSREEEINLLMNGKTIVKLFYKKEKPNYVENLSRVFGNQVIFEVINASFRKAYIFSPYKGEKELEKYDYDSLEKVLCELVINKPVKCVEKII